MNQRKKEEYMPHHIAFDTLAYANRLKQSGADPKLAEALAEAEAQILSDLMDQRLATKDDLFKLKSELQSFIVKTITITIAILGGLQTLFHFIP